VVVETHKKKIMKDKNLSAFFAKLFEVLEA